MRTAQVLPLAMQKKMVKNPMQRWPYCDKPCSCGSGEKLAACCGKMPLVSQEAGKKLERYLEEFYGARKGLSEVTERIKKKHET